MVSSSASSAPATPSLRSLRRERTRDEIAHAALELIRRKGYGDTLVEDIAARALISPRTFYRYFAAKEDAFFHGLPAFEDTLAEFSSTAARGNLAASLVAAGEAFAEAIEAQRDAVLPRLPHALSEPALLGQLVHRLYAAESRLARRLRPLVAAEAPKAWTAEVLAAAITATLMAALRRWHNAPKPHSLGALVKQGMATLEPAIANMDKN